jgi:glutamine amidotransferase
MIGIIDYGCGNVGSVQNMLSKIGIWSEVITDPSQISGKKAIILPGVGAFDTGVQKLTETGFWKEINSVIENDTIPVLGICLGMQLLFEGSEEGNEKGFGFFKGSFKRFSKEHDLRVPHMGWETLNYNQSELNDYFLNPMAKFYFVHSFHAPIDLDENFTLATCKYGIDFPVAVKKNRVVGFQFHPEKSLKFGMELLGNWNKTLEV